MEICVLDRQRSRKVSRPALAAFLRRLARSVPPGNADEMTLCLVSDRRMREYNRRFLGKDGPTDVIAFPGGGEPDPEGRVYLGDVVISVPTAARQARERRHSLARELRILALHGYLHLLGYDHERDDGAMNRLQGRLVRKLLPGRGGRTRR